MPCLAYLYESNNMETKKRIARAAGKLLRIAGWTAASIAVLLLIVQLILGPGVLTPLVNKTVSQYIDGNFSTGKVYVSLFRHFPAVSANIDDFVISYPSSRFTRDSLDNRTDTLASFRKFNVAVNVLSLIKGEINLKSIELDRPRATLKFFGDGSSNLQVIKLSPSEEDSDSTATLPDINLRKVHLADSAVVVCISPSDTALAIVKKLDIRGRRGRMKISADACLYAGTDRWGRIRIPVGLNGRIYAGKGRDEVWKIGCRELEADIAGIQAKLDMMSAINKQIAINGTAEINNFDIQKFINDYAVKFYPAAADIKTDARINASLNVDGYYDPGTSELPAFDAKVDVGDCFVEYSGLDLKPSLMMQVTASATQGGPVGVTLKKLSLKAPGINLDLSGRANGLLGGNPLVDANAGVEADLGELEPLLAEKLKMHLKGKLNANAAGKVSLGTFNLYNPESFDVKSSVALSNLLVRSFDDSLNAYVDSLNLHVALMDDRFKLSPDKKAKALGALLRIDSLAFCQKGAMSVNGKKISLVAQSSPVHVELADGKKFNPLHALLSMGSLSFEGEDSLSIGLRNSRNTLKFTPDRKNSAVPSLSVTSTNATVRAKSGVHRVFLRELGFFANAKMNPVHKDTARLKRTGRFAFNPGMAAPPSRSFIRFDLGESFKKYFTAWDLRGTLKLGRAAVATPAFPMRTAVTGFKGSFTNDAVRLDTLRVISGSSNLAAHGNVSNLRRVLTRGGMIKMALELDTDSLALGELMNAYARGQKNMKRDLSYLDNVADSEYENVTDNAAATDSSAAGGTYIPVPMNVDAELLMRGKGITYSTLDIKDFSADIIMKNRCLQLNNARAITTVGDLYAQAFYSTASRRDISAGFDLDIKSISAADVIALMPKMDTLMPLLKSFGGKLDCSLAATAQLDTSMNILTPSMDGVVRIAGKDLHFQDNEQIARIGRKLLFKQPERATIDTMTVEGMIHDNMLEIFPFFLKMDRWTLALAGIQNMDKSFNYHVSMARTPIILHLGANIYGPDFDHMKFRLGKAKYTESGGVPSFTQVIDTTRINLRNSIRNVFNKGVKQAVADSRSRREFILEQRKKAGYGTSVALEDMEALSSAEQQQADSLSAEQNPVVPETAEQAL